MPGPFAIPGDPWTFRTLIARIASGSQSITAMRRSIGEQSLHGEWSGAAAGDYKSAGQDCIDNLMNLGAALDEAHYALTRFVAELEDAQYRAKRIASQLGECESDLDTAQARVEDARQNVTQAQSARYGASSPAEHQARQQALTAAIASLQGSQAAADELRAQAASLADSAKANLERYEAAARLLCSALSGAHAYAPSRPRRPAPA